MEEDKVNNPSHYASGSIECIDAMLSAFGKEGVMRFCHLNAFKYLWRAGKKDDELEDLKKARWYLDKEIALKESLMEHHSN